MTLTSTTQLPGGATLGTLQAELRRTLARPEVVLDRATCTPVGHTITAPATASLTRVQLIGHDAEPLELALVAKCLQSGARGLPPNVPPEERERLAAAIPWRLEAEIYHSDTADRMPPGLRLPRLFATTEHGDELITLWLEDVEPLDAPWNDDELARAATLLGRLTVRRADQVLVTRPARSFLAHLVTNALHAWAIPLLRGEALWEHPAFAQPEVAALRAELLDVADSIDDLMSDLSAVVPWMNTHGDPTPMNLLRARRDPGVFVLIDWGTAALGPVGWDVVPMVFGPAENGTAPPTDLAARMALAVPAFEAGIAQEGMVLLPGALASAVRAAALVRCPLTSLPLTEATVGQPLREDLMAHARRKARFVRAVLDSCR